MVGSVLNRSSKVEIALKRRMKKLFVYNGMFAQCYLPILTNLSHLDRLYWPGFGGCVEKDK